MNQATPTSAIKKVFEIRDSANTEEIKTYLGKHVQSVYGTDCWTKISILYHKKNKDLVMILSVPKSSEKLTEYDMKSKPALAKDFTEKMLTPGLLKVLPAELYEVEDFVEA